MVDLALEPRISRPVGKEVAESSILIPQTLCQHRGWDFRKPLVPWRALPLGQPPREIISRERQSTGPIGLRADRERSIPQPASRAEPSIEQPSLRAIRIRANAVTSCNAAHVSIITSTPARGSQLRCNDRQQTSRRVLGPAARLAVVDKSDVHPPRSAPTTAKAP